jgi:hypothetical protein
MFLTGSGDELCGPLSALFQAVAYHPPAISPFAFPVFVYLKFLWRTAPCVSPLSGMLIATPPQMCVPFQFLVYYLVVFLFCGVGFSLSRGFIPGVAVGILQAAYLLTFGLLRLVWSWCLVVWEPSFFLSLMWCGEALYGLWVQGVKVLILLGAFLLSSVAPAS